MQPRNDFQAGAKIAPNRNSLQAGFAGIVHHGHLRARSAKNQGIRGNHERWTSGLEVKFHLRIRTRQQFATRIGNLNFDEKRSRRGVDRTRRMRHLAGKRAVRELRNVQIGRHAQMNVVAIGFRDVYIDAQRINLSQAEQLLRVAVADQRADVHVPRSDHAVEWRSDLLERLHILKPLYIS